MFLPGLWFFFYLVCEEVFLTWIVGGFFYLDCVIYLVCEFFKTWILFFFTWFVRSADLLKE